VKILVTGATGFIGRHLVKRLVEEGRPVKCLVRETSDTQSLVGLGIEIFFGDITDPGSVENAIKDVDLIFHLAGEVYPKRSMNYFDINVVGTKNLMNACVGRSIKRVVYFSSTAVYGPTKNNEIPLDESDRCKPISQYGKSKLEAEKVLFHYYEEHGVPITVLRPPVVYGPGLYRFSLPYLILDSVLKRKFVMVGNGNNYTSLCYIDNLIHGALLAAVSEKAIGEIFIISDGENMKLKEIIDFIYNVEGIKSNYHSIPKWIAIIVASFLYLLTMAIKYPIYVSPKTIYELTGGWGANIKKAEELLNYKAVVSFHDGIEITLHNLKDSIT